MMCRFKLFFEADQLSSKKLVVVPRLNFQKLAWISFQLKTVTWVCVNISRSRIDGYVGEIIAYTCRVFSTPVATESKCNHFQRFGLAYAAVERYVFDEKLVENLKFLQPVLWKREGVDDTRLLIHPLIVVLSNIKQRELFFVYKQEKKSSMAKQ